MRAPGDALMSACHNWLSSSGPAGSNYSSFVPGVNWHWSVAPVATCLRMAGRILNIPKAMQTPLPPKCHRKYVYVWCAQRKINVLLIYLNIVIILNRVSWLFLDTEILFYRLNIFTNKKPNEISKNNYLNALNLKYLEFLPVNKLHRKLLLLPKARFSICVTHGTFCSIYASFFLAFFVGTFVRVRVCGIWQMSSGFVLELWPPLRSPSIFACWRGQLAALGAEDFHNYYINFDGTSQGETTKAGNEAYAQSRSSGTWLWGQRGVTWPHITQPTVSESKS